MNHQIPNEEKRITINIKKFQARQQKEERSAKIYENWQQLIKLKKQSYLNNQPKQNQKELLNKTLDVQMKPRSSTPNSKKMDDSEIIKDIMNMKLRLHFIA